MKRLKRKSLKHIKIKSVSLKGLHAYTESTPSWFLFEGPSYRLQAKGIDKLSVVQRLHLIWIKLQSQMTEALLSSFVGRSPSAERAPRSFWNYSKSHSFFTSFIISQSSCSSLASLCCLASTEILPQPGPFQMVTYLAFYFDCALVFLSFWSPLALPSVEQLQGSPVPPLHPAWWPKLPGIQPAAHEKSLKIDWTTPQVISPKGCYDTGGNF